MTPLLSVKDLTAGYGGAPVIENIQLELPKQEKLLETRLWQDSSSLECASLSKWKCNSL